MAKYSLDDVNLRLNRAGKLVKGKGHGIGAHPLKYCAVQERLNSLLTGYNLATTSYCHEFKFL